MTEEAPDPASPTPYAQVLQHVLETARIGRNEVVMRRLCEMLKALQHGRYQELQKLWRSLPQVYQVVTGAPPKSKADDL